MPRPFRTPDSYAAEQNTRDRILPFLNARGFRLTEDRRENRGTSISQTLVGADEHGSPVALWVRLCWRKPAGEIADAHSAAQLLSNVDGNQWNEALTARLRRATENGATHLLLVQNAGTRLVQLAAIPMAAVLPIWRLQRAESRRLIAAGSIPRQKNHAENGRSPTLWLRDINAPSVAAALWDFPGVRDLATLEPNLPDAAAAPVIDDVYDDLTLLGRDATIPRFRTVAGFPRNPRVRASVLRLAGYRCERPNCTAVRDYPGALDSHHILGIQQSDRVTNCVALCPNCHRDAHLHPDHEGLNAVLLEIARRRSARPRVV
jgi:5-methylcytosine-specific restriction protein A